MKKQKGFTLIELLVVITIIGILSAIGIVSYQTANKKARDARRVSDIQQIRSALEVYRSDRDSYPSPAQYSDDMGSYFADGKIPADPNPGASGCVYGYASTGATYTITYCTELGDDDIKIMNP